jgi:hypothetical protein
MSKEGYSPISSIRKTKVDPTTLTINPVKIENWEDICTQGYQYQLLIHKVHKNIRKFPRN